MNHETNRLNTFSNWPASAPVDPIRIAKAGFFYTGEGTEVQCFSCGGKISDWNYGDQVMWRHRRMEPNCAFVVNSQLSGNVPLVLEPGCTTGGETATSWSAPEDQNEPVEPTGDYGLTEEDEMYKSDALRLLSFINWDDESVSREALVNAGFYHTGNGRLRCAWCGGELAPFRCFGSLGPPLEVHRMYFPLCEHAASLEAAQRNTNISPPASPTPEAPQNQPTAENNENQSNQTQSDTVSNLKMLLSKIQRSGAAHNSQLLSSGGTWRALGVVSGGARHPHHAALAARLATFTRWPHDRVQTPQALAEAGFYHTGIDDQVRCFYCDGGLGKWEAGDSPWSEHAYWFPHCGYVLLIKGQEYIDNCQNRTSVQRTFSAESGLNSRRRNPGVNFPITESQVEECMESPAALAALGAGLDAARVRRALARRLRVTGLPFHSSEALIDAVLDEQLNEEAWTCAPHTHRLARDILAETLRDFVPATGIVSRPDSARSESDVTSRSSSPVEPTGNPVDSETNRIQNESESASTVLPVLNVASVTHPNVDNKSVPSNSVEGSPKKEPKNLTLEEENRQLKEARLCKVCMDSEVSVVFLPCGHLVSCGACGAALAACPLCRAPVRALVRAYLA